jgi:hypothetical protein
MLFQETSAVYCDNNRIYAFPKQGQNAEFQNVKVVGGHHCALNGDSTVFASYRTHKI